MAKKQKKSKRPIWSVIQFSDIERWRERADMPKVTLARALGVTNSTWHNWQNGKSVPSVGTQKKVRAFLTKNMALIGGAGHAATASATEPTPKRRGRPPKVAQSSNGSELAGRSMELIRTADMSAFEAVATFFENLSGLMREVQKLVKRQEEARRTLTVARSA